MKISNVSIKRPVTVTMMMLIVVLLGFVSLSKLSVGLYPEFDIPIAVVSTTYSGVGPQEIEELITKPIESVLGTVSGVSGITSTSSEGSSLVILEFDFGMDIESASLEMREKLDLISDVLPDDSNKPMVFKIDPNAFPIINYSITSKNGLLEAQRKVEDKIVSRIERIDGVASVSVTGGYENEVEILLNLEKIQGYGLSNTQIANVLRTENLNLPGGKVSKGSKNLTVRTIGEFESVKEIADLPITISSGAIIKLSDVAEVNLKVKELSSINRVNGSKSIGFSITKQTDFNTVKVAKKVKEEMAKIREEEKDLTITTVLDSSEFITSAIGNVSTSGIIGALLAIFIIYLFLRNIGSTMIIAISIPVSVISTFLMMFAAGVTLNLMTLGGLALGIGMLVDNSIVVLENIYRFRDLGYSRFEAAKEGVQEVGMAVSASTLTTIAVFLPIVFVEGITSTLFKELALTVTFSLIASLVVALTVVPMLASKLLKIDHSVDSLKRFSWFEKNFRKIENGYKKLLSKAIKHKFVTLLIAVIIFSTSIFTAINLGAEFLPSMDEGRIKISVELPINTRVEFTNEYINSIEEVISGIEEIDIVFTSVGSVSNGMFSNNQTNSGSIDLLLTSMSEREKSTLEITDYIRNLLVDFTGAEIIVEMSSQQGMSGSMSITPIEVAVKGDDLVVLENLSNNIIEMINNIEGTREVSSSLGKSIEELQVKINRDIASQYGLTTYTISSAVKDAISGVVGTRYKTNGTEIDVVIKMESYLKDNINNFKGVNIKTPTGISIPLSNVASIEIGKGPIAIERSGQVRVVKIGGQLSGRDLKSVNKDIEKELKNIYFPAGYTYNIGGDYEELVNSFSSLFLAMGLAILLVYMIMASQFESLIYPFIIMFSVPLAISGGIFVLKLTNNLISMPALIGVIMLTGIVVNNGIVLVDYINTLRNKNKSAEEAVLEAGPTRLRPIIMTTLTTVLGLVPMASGISEGSEATAPLALVVIGGLLLSTLLTLILIPVVYLLLNKLSRKKVELV